MAVSADWSIFVEIFIIFSYCYCCLLSGLLFSRYLPLVVTRENFGVPIKDYSGDFVFGSWFFTPHIEGGFPH